MPPAPPTSTPPRRMLDGASQNLRQALAKLDGSRPRPSAGNLRRVNDPTGRTGKMTRTTLKLTLMASSILASAGYASAQDKTLTIESWRNDDLAIWQDKIIPAFEAKNPGIKVEFSPIGADRIQRGAQRQARRRHGRRPDHLPAVRPVAGELYSKGKLADLNDLPGMENFSRRRQVGLDDRRRQGDASACRWPRSSTASSTTRTPSTSSASRCRRPRTSSSPRSTRSRPTAPTSRWPWAPRTSGKPRPWATRTSARTTGRARKAATR